MELECIGNCNFCYAYIVSKDSPQFNYQNLSAFKDKHGYFPKRLGGQVGGSLICIDCLNELKSIISQD